MTLIFDGAPGTKLGEDKVDGMHDLLADDDLSTYELEDDGEDDEDLRRRPAPPSPRPTPPNASIQHCGRRRWRPIRLPPPTA
jgi:hypothetical protein